MKSSLLIVAHGSRRASSNEEVTAVVTKVAQQLGQHYAQVGVAFLEFATPSITEQLEQAFNQGVDKVFVLPYFLSQGNHVERDIPCEIDKALMRWPNKEVILLPHIGAADAMASLIARSCIT